METSPHRSSIPGVIARGIPMLPHPLSPSSTPLGTLIVHSRNGCNFDSGLTSPHLTSSCHLVLFSSRNAKQLINFDTKEVVWDCVSDNREEFTRIISSASTLQPEEAVRRTSMISGTVRMSPISKDRTWNVRAESDGTLVRDGEIGDLVAWVVEHEKKVVMTLNANSSLTYLYSSSLPVEAWLVDMKTYKKVVSNKCSFSPPTTARKALTPISQLKIAEKEGRRIDRAIEYLPPGHAGERGDQPFSRLFFSPTAATS